MTAAVIGHLLDVHGLSTKTDAAFRTALYQQATAAGFNPNHIATVVGQESNFKPDARNPSSGALGGLQWMPAAWTAAARVAGRPDVPREALAGMSLAEQVPFMIAYFKNTPIGSHPAGKGAGEYWLATVLPAFVGAPDAAVIGQRGSTDPLLLPSGQPASFSLGTFYAQNAGLDHDGDGVITVRDIRAPAEAAERAASALPLVDVYGSPTSVPAEASSLMAGAGLVFFCPCCGSRFPVVHVVRGEA